MQTTDIMIHIDETLDTVQQQALESRIRGLQGVIAPRFNKPHLLLVAYNPDRTSSAVLLDAVKARGYTGRMVGL
ncbi:hypothetical protein CCR95_07695 [Thiocystis minor]|uniref:ATP-binding protein n=1 Tax=Thiocystis minor TaxID=61597 RepID=UPI00191334BF|nr:ATP-binding protein [Thiocystis minor]MBK5963973.1 hypothetical protein [Thiocystis minor]